MEEKQEQEWLEAQKIEISEDLVAVAKRQLEFLAAVDRRRWLYDGPGLDRAIYRYKTCWLPLLAKYTESGASEDCLIIPLDCEWIWHCHRLNPVQYKRDCEKFYRRILDNQHVQSSLTEKSKSHTVEIWTKLYPQEPFELDYSSLSDISSIKCSSDMEAITYDLVAAVKRQSSFYYQVARPSMSDDCFLKDAVARYKGFLHLIRRNQERSMKRFCVPTYDIDLMWHSHQLQPLSYCKDLEKLLGRVLEHDDTDSDRTKGKKLDTGFSETTTQWEDTFGLRYWRAGAMYRGSPPSPVEITPKLSNYDDKSMIKSANFQKYLPCERTMVVEVLLEIIRTRNLTASQKGNLFVSVSKKQPDKFFSGSCTLNIFSESGEKQVAGFQCEPTGDLVLTLMSRSTSNMNRSMPAKTIGITSISLQDLIKPDSKLSIEKWFELKTHSSNVQNKLAGLHVAASFTVPVPAPYILQIVKSNPISINSCFFPLPGMVQHNRRWIRFMDDNGNEIISLQMRNSKTTKGINNSPIRREVFGATTLSGKLSLLAEFTENIWSLKQSNFSLHLKNNVSNDMHIFELIGDKQMKLYAGKRLEYETKNSNKQTQHNFITVVNFSAENPYGKAVALLGLKSGLLKVNEEWFVLPGILLLFILSDMFKKQGYGVLIRDEVNVKETTNLSMRIDAQNLKKMAASAAAQACVAEMGGTVAPVKGGSCGSGCGGKCGTLVKGGSCGNSCGGNCGNVVNGGEPARCGGGCSGGGGCGNITVGSDKSGGCSGACSSSCGNAMMANDKTGGCGGGCSGGCGGSCSNGVVAGDKSGGCGGACSSSCGNAMMANDKAGGCGGGCGGGCSNGVVPGDKSGGCGGACSSSCGNAMMANDKTGGCSGGCSGGCGGGCSNGVVAGDKSGGCGSACGNCGAEATPIGGNTATVGA